MRTARVRLKIRTFFEEKEPYKIKNSLFKAILNELEFLHNQNIKMPNNSKRFFDIVCEFSIR